MLYSGFPVAVSLGARRQRKVRNMGSLGHTGSCCCRMSWGSSTGAGGGAGGTESLLVSVSKPPAWAGVIV